MGNLSSMYNSLKRSPDNQFYLNLIQLLEFKLSTIKNQLIDAEDDKEIHRLQAKAREIRDTLRGLELKPRVLDTYDGGYGG